MPSFVAILAPIALLLPLGLLGLPVENAPDARLRDTQHEGPTAELRSLTGSVPGLTEFSQPLGDQTANQVRIERRVILRVSPRSTVVRNSLLADMPSSPMESRVVERKVGKCLDFGDIAGVRADSGSRLVLFMRDQRIIAADLEKSCSARDFYSGFYYERNKDGRLCVERDRLQSRSGAKCQVSRLRQLLLEDE